MFRWIVLLALVLAICLSFLIKSGLTVKTSEESAVHPGQAVELYHEHAASTYLRAKDKIREIQKTSDEQNF